MLVQRFEPQDRHFTNFHYYYYYYSVIIIISGNNREMFTHLCPPRAYEVEELRQEQREAQVHVVLARGGPQRFEDHVGEEGQGQTGQRQ